jgi:uncharacterized protein
MCAPITRSGIHANSFLTAAFQPDLNCSCRSHPDRDENAQLARFSNLLAHYTGEKGDQHIASRAMRCLATPEIATGDLSAPVLLAEMQFTHTPLHVTVVGGKRDEAARSLFRAALSAGLAYKRFEWWDPAEGPLPRADIQYPSLAHAAAFLCTASTCSAPITDSRVLQSLSAKSTEEISYSLSPLGTRRSQFLT